MVVDIGFIVFNEPNYPNFTALLAHLGVPSQAAPMSFAVSLDDGAFEYSSNGLRALFAQKRNLANPRFWAMLGDIRRFHATAPQHLERLDASMQSLGDYLQAERYGEDFRLRHLLPQGAAIWSSSLEQIADYPASAFIRFYKNHRLLEYETRPTWRTVEGGSRAYIDGLEEAYLGKVVSASPVIRVVRGPDYADVVTAGGAARYDHVVLATHADQALRLLSHPSQAEQDLLGAIRYRPNRVVLHSDRRLMPRRRAAWAAWNHVGPSGGEAGVTYWMNELQSLPGRDLFVSLNPAVEPRPETVMVDRSFDHPLLDGQAIRAQRDLWSLQGAQRTWFCGAWFGSGFHEDGLQAGLAVAEQLGGVRRPWRVDDESGRIVLAPAGRSAA